MKTQKGYILPIVLIVILLILAGFFLFTDQKVESPTIEIQDVTTTSSVQEPVTLISDTEVDIEEENSTSSSINSGDNEENDNLTLDQCIENSDCPEDSVCYFKPGGNIGACTGL